MMATVVNSTTIIAIVTYSKTYLLRAYLNDWKLQQQWCKEHLSRPHRKGTIVGTYSAYISVPALYRKSLCISQTVLGTRISKKWVEKAGSSFHSPEILIKVLKMILMIVAKEHILTASSEDS